MKLSQAIAFLQSEVDRLGDGEIPAGDSFTSGELMLLILPTDPAVSSPALDYISDPAGCSARSKMLDALLATEEFLSQPVPRAGGSSEMLEERLGGIGGYYVARMVRDAIMAARSNSAPAPIVGPDLTPLDLDAPVGSMFEPDLERLRRDVREGGES